MAVKRLCRSEGSLLFVEDVGSDGVVAGVTAFGHSHAAGAVNGRGSVTGKPDDGGELLSEDLSKFHHDFSIFLTELQGNFTASCNFFHLAFQAAKGVLTPWKIVHGQKQIVP